LSLESGVKVGVRRPVIVTMGTVRRKIVSKNRDMIHRKTGITFMNGGNI